MHNFDSMGSLFRRMRSSASVDPIRDWLMLLTLAMIAFVGIVVWNVWAFDTVAGGGTIGAPTIKAPVAFNPAALDTIRTIFVNRAAEEAKYMIGVYSFTDPSL